MIQKTKIINNLNKERILKWAGKAGVSIGPMETIELDGIYPSACRDNKAYKIFEYEYNQGMFKAAIVTDMSVSRLKIPDHIKENIEKVVETQKVEANHIALKPSKG